MREALGSPHVDSRASRGPGREALLAARRSRSSRPRSATSTTPTSILVVGTDPLHSSPILDLRIRKAIRRNGARLAVATERPTALDGGAEAVARYAPGERRPLPRRAGRRARRTPRTAPPPLAEVAARTPSSVVVVWGERIGRDGEGAVDGAARRSPRRSASPSTDGSGLLEVPDFANARGLREAGCLPDAGPGLRRRPTAGRSTEEIRAALESRRARRR